MPSMENCYYSRLQKCSEKSGAWRPQKKVECDEFEAFFLFFILYPLYYTKYNTAHAASRLWRYSSIYMNPSQAA